MASNSLNSQRQPRTADPPVSILQELGLQTCTTIPSLYGAGDQIQGILCA